MHLQQVRNRCTAGYYLDGRTQDDFPLALVSCGVFFCGVMVASNTDPYVSLTFLVTCGVLHGRLMATSNARLHVPSSFSEEGECQYDYTSDGEPKRNTSDGVQFRLDDKLAPLPLHSFKPVVCEEVPVLPNTLLMPDGYFTYLAQRNSTVSTVYSRKVRTRRNSGLTRLF